MQYLLLIYGNEAGMQSATKARHRADDRRLWRLHRGDEEGRRPRRRRTACSRPASATTVRVADGKTKVLDGPYAETKEQLGGYYLIDVPDLDAALSWAARCPGASVGTIEVRPVWTM